MESLIINGNGTATGNANLVSKWKIKLIQNLLKTAKLGQIIETSMPCDGGPTIVKGYLSNGNLVELDVAMDCGVRRVNNSPATDYLLDIATKICDF